MEGLPGEPTALFLLLFLLPGFLGLQVYDYLTVGAKRDGLQKIVTALCLTLLSNLAVRALVGIELIQLPKITKETPVSEVLGEFLGLNLLYLSWPASSLPRSSPSSITTASSTASPGLPA